MTREEDEETRLTGMKIARFRVSHSAQADFVVGRRNSMTIPRSAGGSHFTRFKNLIGM